MWPSHFAFYEYKISHCCEYSDLVVPIMSCFDLTILSGFNFHKFMIWYTLPLLLCIFFLLLVRLTSYRIEPYIFCQICCAEHAHESYYSRYTSSTETPCNNLGMREGMICMDCFCFKNTEKSASFFSSLLFSPVFTFYN